MLDWFKQVVWLVPNWAWFAIIGGIALACIVIIILTTCIGKGDKQKEVKNEPEPVLMLPEAETEKTESKEETVKEEVVAPEEPVVLAEEQPVEEKKPATKKTTTKKAAPKAAEEKPIKEETAEKASAKKEEKPAAKTAAKKEGTAAKTTAAKKEGTAAKSTAAKKEEKPAAKAAVKEESSASDTKVYHISKRKEDKKWQVKAEGADKALRLFFTQNEAIDYAKKVAGKQEGRIVVHKEGGGFRKLNY